MEEFIKETVSKLIHPVLSREGLIVRFGIRKNESFRFQVSLFPHPGCIVAEGWCNQNSFEKGERSVIVGRNFFDPGTVALATVAFDTNIFGNDLKDEPVKTLPLTKAIRETLPLVLSMKSWYFSSFANNVLQPLESARMFSPKKENVARYVVNELVNMLKLPVLPTFTINNQTVVVDLLGYEVLTFIVDGGYLIYQGRKVLLSQESLLFMIEDAFVDVKITLGAIEKLLLAIKINDNFDEVEYYLRLE